MVFHRYGPMCMGIITLKLIKRQPTESVWSSLDKSFVWHPFTQMEQWNQGPSHWSLSLGKEIIFLIRKGIVILDGGLAKPNNVQCAICSA